MDKAILKGKDLKEKTGGTRKGNEGGHLALSTNENKGENGRCRRVGTKECQRENVKYKPTQLIWEEVN